MSKLKTKEDSSRSSLASTLTSLSPGRNKLSSNNPLSNFLTQRSRELDLEINAVKSKLHSTSPAISNSTSTFDRTKEKFKLNKSTVGISRKEETPIKNRNNQSSIFSTLKNEEASTPDDVRDKEMFSKELVNILARIKLKAEDSTMSESEIQELFLPSHLMTPGNYYIPLNEVLDVLQTDLLLALTKRDIKIICDTYGRKDRSTDTYDINIKSFLEDAGIWTEESMFFDYSPSSSPGSRSKSPDRFATSIHSPSRSPTRSPSPPRSPIKSKDTKKNNKLVDDSFDNIDEKIESYIEKYLEKSKDYIKEKISNITSGDQNNVSNNKSSNINPDSVDDQFLSLYDENKKLKKELSEYNDSFVNEYGNLKTKYSTLQSLIDDDPHLRKKLYRKLALENPNSTENILTKNEKLYLTGKKWNEKDTEEDNEEDSRKKLLRKSVYDRLAKSGSNYSSISEIDPFNPSTNKAPWTVHHAMTAMQNASEDSTLVQGPYSNSNSKSYSNSFLPYNFETNETLQDGGLNAFGTGKYREERNNPFTSTEKNINDISLSKLNNYIKDFNSSEKKFITYLCRLENSTNVISGLIHELIKIGNQNSNELIRSSLETKDVSKLKTLKKDNLYIKFNQFYTLINSIIPQLTYNELKDVAYGFSSDGANGVKVNDIVLMLEDMLYNLVGSHEHEDPNHFSFGNSSRFTKDSSWPLSTNSVNISQQKSSNSYEREQEAIDKVDFASLLLKLSKILITLPLISYQPSHLLTRDLHPNYKKFLLSSFLKYDKELSGVITFGQFKKILTNEYGIKNFSHIEFLVLIKPFALLVQEGKKKLANINDIDDDLKNFSLLQNEKIKEKNGYDKEFELEKEKEILRRKNKREKNEELNELKDNESEEVNDENILEKIREKKFQEYLDTEKKFSTANLNKFLDENNLLTTQEIEEEKEKLLLHNAENFSPSVQIAYVAFIQALCRCLKALKDSKLLTEMNKKGKTIKDGRESITWIGELNEIQASESLSWTIHAFSLVDFLLNQLESMPLSKRRHTLLTLNYLLEENELKNDDQSSSSGLLPGKVDGFTFLSSLLQVGFHLPRYFRLEILNYAEGNGGKIHYLPLLLTFSKTLLDWTNGEKEIVRIILEAMGVTVDSRRSWLKKLKFLLINEANKENNIKNNIRSNFNDDIESLKHIQPLVSPASFLSILRELNVNLTVSQEAALLDGLDGERVAKLQAEMWSEQIKASNPQYIGTQFSANVNNVQKFALKKRKMNAFLGSGSVTNSSLGGIYSLPMIDFSSFLKFCSRHCGTWMDSSPEFYSHLVETFKKIQLPLLALQEFINSCRSMDAEVTGIISERSFRIAICRSRLFSYLTEDEIDLLCKFLSEETINGIDYILFSLQIHSICSNLSQNLVENSSLPGGVMPPSFSNMKEMLNLEDINVNGEGSNKKFNVNLPTSASIFASEFKDKSFNLINQLAENGCDWQGQLLPLRNYLVNNTDIQNLFLTYSDLNDMLREFSVIYRREDIDVLYLDIGIELNLTELKHKKLIEKKLKRKQNKLHNEYDDYENINDIENELEIDEYCSRFNTYDPVNDEQGDYAVQNNIVKVFDTQKLLLKLMNSRIHWTRRNPAMTRNLQKKLMMVSEVLLEEESNNNITATSTSSWAKKGNRMDLLKEKSTEFLMKLINRIEAFSRVDNIQTISINEWASTSMNRTSIKPSNTSIKGLGNINQDPMDLNTQIQNNFNDFIDENNTIYNALRTGNITSSMNDNGNVNTTSLLIPREVFKSICHAMNFQLTSEDITYLCDCSDPLPECPRVNPLLLYDLLTIGTEQLNKENNRNSSTTNEFTENEPSDDIDKENLSEACIFSLNHLRTLIKKAYLTTKRTRNEWKQDVFTLFNGFDKENKNFITFDQFVLGLKLLGIHLSSTDLLKNLHPYVISSSNKATSPVFYKKILSILFRNLNFLGKKDMKAPKKSPYEISDDEEDEDGDYDEIIKVKDIKLSKSSKTVPDKINVNFKIKKDNQYDDNDDDNIKKTKKIRKNSSVFMLLKIIREIICKKYFITNNKNVQEIWLDLLKIFEKFDPQGLNCITEREFCLGLSILLSNNTSGFSSINSLGNNEDDKFVLTTEEWYEIFKFFEIKEDDDDDDDDDEVNTKNKILKNKNNYNENKKWLRNLKLKKKKNEIFINYIKFIELILDTDELDKKLAELKQNKKINDNITTKFASTFNDSSSSSILSPSKLNNFNKEKNLTIKNILKNDEKYDKKNRQNYLKSSTISTSTPSLSSSSSSLLSPTTKFSTNFIKNDEGKSILKVKQTKIIK